MKILFVYSGNSGQAPLTTRQANSLMKVGLNVEFYNLIGKGFFGYLSNVLKLRKHIKNIKPDILHAHYSFSGFATTLAFTRIPIVVSLMGSDIHASGRLLKVILKMFILFWDCTIVKSDEMYKILGKLNAQIVPNGVDFNAFYPISLNEAREKLGWNHNKYHILFAGDPIRWEKNFSLAKLALDRFEREVSDFEVHYLMNIPMDEMVYYYNAADLLLLTSIYEGSPNVIKEAMVCNCPIVTTNVGDVKKVLKNTTNSYITSFNDYEIYEKIKDVIKAKQRSNGRDNIKELDSNVIAYKLFDIYKSIQI